MIPRLAVVSTAVPPASSGQARVTGAQGVEEALRRIINEPELCMAMMAATRREANEFKVEAARAAVAAALQGI